MAGSLKIRYTFFPKLMGLRASQGSVWIVYAVHLELWKENKKTMASVLITSSSLPLCMQVCAGLCWVYQLLQLPSEALNMMQKQQIITELQMQQDKQ